MTPARCSLALVTAVISVLAPLSATAAPAPGPTTTQTYAADVRAATNAERTERGRVALKPDACLRRAAQRQAERMARDRQLSHTTDLGALAQRCGLRAVGENVAYHPGDGRAVVAAWMGSSGHRANILERDFRHLGVGAVRRHGTWWAVQVFGRKA